MSVLVFVFFFDLMHIELSFAILSKKKKGTWNLIQMKPVFVTPCNANY